VLSLLTKEAEKAKKNRVRTILAVLFLRVEKIALHKLPAQAKLVFRMGFTGFKTSESDDAHWHDNLALRLSWAASRPAAAGALGVAGGERGE
jgi:hypothetical protein